MSGAGCPSSLFLPCRFLRVECAFAAPFPEGENGAGFVGLDARGAIEHRAVEDGAIVVGQLDQTGFLDEAAQLYEVAGAFASGHDPFPRIGAARSGFNAVPRLRQFRFRLCRHSEGGA